MTLLVLHPENHIKSIVPFLFSMINAKNKLFVAKKVNINMFCMLSQGVELNLKHVHASGVYGWASVCEITAGDWLEDISQNQVC